MTKSHGRVKIVLFHLNPHIPALWKTPVSVEGLGKVYHKGVRIFKCTHLLCDLIRFITEEANILLEVPNELIYLEFTLPLSDIFHKSSTARGVRNWNGVV